MATNWRESSSKWIRSIILWGYGWQRRTHTTFGRRIIQWKHPDTGLWYREATAMRLLTADLLASYNH
ncbi:MAG: hypothetical protein ACU843_11380 [Gammaproteobacteria bacterium]